MWEFTHEKLFLWRCDKSPFLVKIGTQFLKEIIKPKAHVLILWFVLVWELFHTYSDEGTGFESCPETSWSHFAHLFCEQQQKQWTDFPQNVE